MFIRVDNTLQLKAAFTGLTSIQWSRPKDDNISGRISAPGVGGIRIGNTELTLDLSIDYLASYLCHSLVKIVWLEVKKHHQVKYYILKNPLFVVFF